MNNHTPHNNEQRQDENPFGNLLKRALLHREGESTDTAQHQSDAPEYQPQSSTDQSGSDRNAFHRRCQTLIVRG